MLLRLIRKKKLWQDPERLIEDARKKQQKGPAQPADKIKMRVRVERDDSLGFPVFTFRPNSDDSSSDRRALYLHGGGYVHDFGPGHFKLIATLVERTGLTVVAPGYPLAPDHTWPDSWEAVVGLAPDQGEAPLLMGDSAGAGFALAVAETLAAEGRHPEVILISPYGDALASDSRTAEYDARDPYLAAVGVRAVIGAWAGDDDPKRPEISPLFGSMAGLGRMLLFTGTRDTIHPQAHQIRDKAQAEGVDCRMVVADGCIHVYPLMPIPEARRAMDTIVDFVAETAAADPAKDADQHPPTGQ